MLPPRTRIKRLRNLVFLRKSDRRGVALVLVLAFVVLLASIIVAFFSRALAEQQISRSSANQTKGKLLADGAVDTIVGDLKSEIVAGSTAVPITAGGVTTTIYTPRSSSGNTYAENRGAYTTMLPATQGFTRATYSSTTPDPLANLVKVSANGAPFYPAGGAYTAAGPTRAANSPTNTGARPISLARWNKPLFLAATSTADLTPTGTFPVPNWIYVAKDGTNNATPYNQVTGRYAYVIYDEGGLLDINVAGYPNSMAPTTTLPDVAYKKNALAYADLTLIGLSQAQVDSIVGWRNASSSATTDKYKKYAFFNRSGFLKTSNEDLAAGESDRMFSSRQEFISFLKNKAPNFGQQTQDALQYLTTFSRDLDQPSYIRLQSVTSTGYHQLLDHNPDVPKVLPTTNGGNYYKPPSTTTNATQNHDHEVNPSFPSVRVTSTTGFPRSDGSTAVAGEPLVKKRFALNRLAWLTYRGPSANRSQGDADIQALINNGIPWDYLQKGTDENIRNYFGLNWTGSKWTYSNNHSGGAGPIHNLADLTGTREPDFFELLKATINVGSVGKALLPQSGTIDPNNPDPYKYNYYPEASVDFQILQMGANIISQYQPTNYPPQIFFDDGAGKAYSQRTIVGVGNLPYLYYILSGVLQVDPPTSLPRRTAGDNFGTGEAGNSFYKAGDDITNPGVGALMELPVIWNPHDPSSPLTNANGLTPSEIRVVADSATPADAEAGGPYSEFFVFAKSDAPGVTGQKQYSYAAEGGASWYADSSGTGNGIKKPFKADQTEINLQLSGTKTLFPEPTILMRPGSIQDSNGNTITVSVPSENLMQKDPAVKGLFTNGGLPSFTPNAPGLQAGESLAKDQAKASYIGFYLGAFPLAWKYSSTGAPLSAAKSGCFLSKFTATAPSSTSGLPAGDPNACYMTYRMQYKDPNTGVWVTYDTKYGKVIDGDGGATPTKFAVGTPTVAAPSLICGAGSGGPNPPAKPLVIGNAGFWASATDPRTSRFGLFWNSTNNKTRGIDSLNSLPRVALPIPGAEFEWNVKTISNATGWLDTANGILYTTRPDANTGFWFSSGWPFTYGDDGKTSGWMAWASSDGADVPGIAPGLLSQNNTDIPYEAYRFYGSVNGNDLHTPNYFADPDGMVRRGMGAFVPSGTKSSPNYNTLTNYNGGPSADTTVGLPMTRAFDWNKNNTSTNRPNNPNPTTTVYTSPTQVTSQAQSRPYFLHRPFYSVAELGYVFSDTPWRNLDFFTAESGSAALLDVFCINDTDDPNGLVAGKVNLNSAQAPVLQAVLAGAYLDPVQPGSGGATGRLNQNAAKAVANALEARLHDTTNINNGTGWLKNVSELVGKWVANKAIVQLPAGGSPTGLRNNRGTLDSNKGFYDGKLSYAGFSGGVWDNTSTNLGSTSRKPFANGVENFSTGKPLSTGTAMDIYSAYVGSGAFSPSSRKNGTQETATYIQRFREAPIRALVSAGQTRVWNLMIDVVAQSGRFPQSAAALDQFMVEGEQRYWVHVAIDRYTGQVIDKQIEVVKE